LGCIGGGGGCCGGLASCLDHGDGMERGLQRREMNRKKWVSLLPWGFNIGYSVIHSQLVLLGKFVAMVLVGIWLSFKLLLLESVGVTGSLVM
jgi:hypothetical protein